MPRYSDRLEQSRLAEERRRMDEMIADPWRQQFRANNPRMQYDPAAESTKSTAALDAYNDPVRRNMAAGTRALGIPDFTGHNLISAAEFLPGVGDAMDAQDSAIAFGKGDYLTGGLLGGAAAIGLVPGVGDALGGAIGGMVKGTGKAADAFTDARKGIRAYHGSPHDFDKFDMSKIGTGDGRAVFGSGMNFSEDESVARYWRDRIAREGKHKKKKLYEVDIDANPDEFVWWDEPLNSLSDEVRAQLPPPRKLEPHLSGHTSAKSVGASYKNTFPDNLYSEMDAKEFSKVLESAGYKGIRRLNEKGTTDYVVFDDKLISLIRKYGLAALLAGGGMGAWGMAPEGGEPPPL